MDKLEQIKNAVTANGMREWTDERVGQAMREYADQQNAELRERVKELLSQLTKYREALERIATADVILLGEFARKVSKEALKQEEEI